MKFTVYLALLIILPCIMGQKGLDIFLALSEKVENTAVQLNGIINEKVPENEINFKTNAIPHISLYLTLFEDTTSVLDALTQLIPTLGHSDCVITLPPSTSVGGAYGMWEADRIHCMQYFSDAIVNNTYEFIVPDQPVPSWVYQLPEPVRSEKLALFKKYGSPNVFSQFDPHITLAYAPNATNLDQVFANLPVPLVDYVARQIKVGLVDERGIIDIGDVIASFDLPQPFHLTL